MITDTPKASPFSLTTSYSMPESWKLTTQRSRISTQESTTFASRIRAMEMSITWVCLAYLSIYLKRFSSTLETAASKAFISWKSIRKRQSSRFQFRQSALDFSSACPVHSPAWISVSWHWTRSSSRFSLPQEHQMRSNFPSQCCPSESTETFCSAHCSSETFLVSKIAKYVQ